MKSHKKMSKKGIILCSERFPRNGFTASPVSDGRHLSITCEFGEVRVVKVGDRFQQVANSGLSTPPSQTAPSTSAPVNP